MSHNVIKYNFFARDNIEATVLYATTKKYSRKTMLYCYACYIHKRIYYYHKIARINSEMRIFFLEHQYFIHLCSVDLCVYSLVTCIRPWKTDAVNPHAILGVPRSY